MKSCALVGILLALGVLAMSGCSEDSDCPVCPTCYAGDRLEWVLYDDFNDEAIDEDLWITTILYGGQVLEAAGRLQVWGHTGTWTGAGIIRTIESSNLAWRFDLVEQYFEEGPGCQGWHIVALNPGNTIRVEILNGVTAGCSPSWDDEAGGYVVRNEVDSLSVYLDGTLLRRLPNGGIGAFKLEFIADNVYGSGHHSHIFVDNVERLELAP